MIILIKNKSNFNHHHHLRYRFIIDMDKLNEKLCIVCNANSLMCSGSEMCVATALTWAEPK